jgi:hypothetical protein
MRTPTGMTPCTSSLRLAPSLALLLGLAGALAACVDPKLIGQESNDEDSGSAESGSEGESSGSTTQGQTTQGQTEGPDTDTDPTSGESGTEPCSPIEIPECVTCECTDGAWSCDDSACIFDCTDQACGTACMMCTDAPDCPTAPEFEGVCTADGQCVGTPPPELGFCEGALQPGFENELDVVAGCVDVLVFARDAADERGLRVSIEQGLVAAALASGEPVHAELSATDPAVELVARAGFGVTMMECSDVFGPGIDVQENWLPSGGTVIVDVAPADFEQATATVQLVDVVLHRVQPGPAPIVVNMTFTDVGVGWFPG